MASRYHSYAMKDGVTRLGQDYFNPILRDVDGRLASLEALKITWERAVDELNAFGLTRIDESIAPLLAQLQDDAAAVIATLESLGDVATAAQGALAESALQPENLGVETAAELTNVAALATLTGQADRLAYFSAAGVLALTTLSAAARTLLAASDGASQRAALGVRIGTDVQAYSAALTEWAGKARPGGTVVGTSDAQEVSAKTMVGVREKRTAPSISGGALTLDCSAGNVFEVALNSNVTSLSFSNVPSSGDAFGAVLVLTADGTQRTVTWPAAVKWAGGSAPTLTATSGKKDIVILTTWDGGTAWYATVAGQDF